MENLLSEKYPETLHLNELISKQGIYKDYQYFTTFPHTIKVQDSKNLSSKYGNKGYVIIKPNQQGYRCNTGDFEDDDAISPITFDKKDAHGNRVIGFRGFDDNSDTPWTTKKIINECQFIIDDLAEFDKNVISVEVVSLLQGIKQDMEINDLAVESFKQIDSILNTEQSHNAVKAIKKAQVKDTDKSIKNAFNILNKALFQAHINVFDCAYNYWN